MSNTQSEAVAWLNRAAGIYSQDAQIFRGHGDQEEADLYATVADELRKCAKQLEAQRPSIPATRRGVAGSDSH